MLTAYNAQKQQILATHARKEEVYHCPICKEVLILRQGVRKGAHFAHYRHSMGHLHLKGESVQHARCKSTLYEQLCKLDSSTQLEPYIKNITQIPDIIFGTWAIEIQLSSIAIKTMRARTEGLQSEGYHVLWLAEKPQMKKGLYVLSQLQQQCILPSTKTLYCIDTTSYELFRLSRIMPITAKTFHGELTPLSIQAFSHALQQDPQYDVIVRKLSTSQILKYIQQCRRQNSVLEPTLSLMYQMRMLDEQVAKVTGFLFPEQIYIHTHPVLWQLYILKCLQAGIPSHSLLLKQLKFRHFAVEACDRQQIINRIVQRYLKLLNL
ncbi:competence protein CoiA [Staphylococcus delphini]|uniref:competence protein CoiA n=1 Tax=Staphylococcus delphini TaxID=53344 RepID=UPI000BBCA0E1|nr:competence protein CoiA family protein [Staphylococcus delphini]PCF47262.1 competence protein CoiA [Staphylococcus delphini]PCF72769.1 competence protein CoiA [Staphylococcus delphini]